MSREVSQFYGPPQSSPFDKLSEAQKSRFDKALAIADGVKLYQTAGGIGVASQWAPHAQQLAKRGGLSETEALTLARYRMWKNGLPVPTERQPDLTPEETDARRAEFVNGDATIRSRLMDEDKRAIFNSHQNYFDDLVKKTAMKPPEAIAKPGIVAAEPQRPPLSIAREEQPLPGTI